MSSLSGLVSSGVEFTALKPAAAAPFLLHAARGVSTDGVFCAAALLTKREGVGMECADVPAYADVSAQALAEKVDIVLQFMVEQGSIVPCHTASLAGRFRIVEAP